MINRPNVNRRLNFEEGENGRDRKSEPRKWKTNTKGRIQESLTLELSKKSKLFDSEDEKCCTHCKCKKQQKIRDLFDVLPDFLNKKKNQSSVNVKDDEKKEKSLQVTPGVLKKLNYFQKDDVGLKDSNQRLHTHSEVTHVRQRKSSPECVSEPENNVRSMMAFDVEKKSPTFKFSSRKNTSCKSIPQSSIRLLTPPKLLNSKHIKELSMKAFGTEASDQLKVITSCNYNSIPCPSTTSKSNIGGIHVRFDESTPHPSELVQNKPLSPVFKITKPSQMFLRNSSKTSSKFVHNPHSSKNCDKEISISNILEHSKKDIGHELFDASGSNEKTVCFKCNDCPTCKPAPESVKCKQIFSERSGKSLKKAIDSLGSNDALSTLTPEIQKENQKAPAFENGGDTNEKVQSTSEIDFLWEIRESNSIIYQSQISQGSQLKLLSLDNIDLKNNEINKAPERHCHNIGMLLDDSFMISPLFYDSNNSNSLNSENLPMVGKRKASSPIFKSENSENRKGNVYSFIKKKNMLLTTNNHQIYVCEKGNLISKCDGRENIILAEKPEKELANYNIYNHIPDVALSLPRVSIEKSNSGCDKDLVVDGEIATDVSPSFVIPKSHKRKASPRKSLFNDRKKRQASTTFGNQPDKVVDPSKDLDIMQNGSHTGYESNKIFAAQCFLPGPSWTKKDNNNGASQMIEDFSSENLVLEAESLHKREANAYVQKLIINTTDSETDITDAILGMQSCNDRQTGGAIFDKKKRKVGPLELQIMNLIKKLGSERRVRIYEKEKDVASVSNGGKVFRVLDVKGGFPLHICGLEDNGLAVVIINKEVVQNIHAIYPGCWLRIYPPWDVMNATKGGITTYVSICTCDIIHDKAVDLKSHYLLEWINADPYINDPDLFYDGILGRK